MNAERIVVEAAVARLWRVFPTRLHYWRREGRFDSDVKEKANHGHTHYYKLSTLDALHAQWARGFTADITVPSTEELLALDGDALLKGDEAATAIGKPYRHIRYGIRDEFLPYFRISPGRVLRLPVEPLLAAASTEGTVTQDVAKKVLLVVGENAIDELGRAGHLERTHVKGVREWQVDRQSLDAFLGRQLDPTADAAEWWRRNMLETRPPLTKLQMALTYHTSPEIIQDEMDAGRLPHIRTVGGWVLIPQLAIDEFIDQRGAWGAGKVAALLGVPEQVAAEWLRHRSLCSIRHQKAKLFCPSTDCMRRYITDNRIMDNFSADDWLGWSMRDGATPMLNSDLVAETPGVDQIDVTEALTNGTLRGIRLPRFDGVTNAAIARSDAVAWRRVQIRRLRREYE
jgi:hypothetical protein